MTFRPDPKPEKKVKDKKYRIPKASKKREKENKQYLIQREKFLPGKFCPINGEQATEVHHMKGRIGKLLLDENYWLGVSSEGHDKIEKNPEWAKEMGYSLNRL